MNVDLFFKPFLYLDPGSGSFLIQILLAGLLGIAVGVRMYWKKIIAFFTRDKADDTLHALDAMDEYGGQDEPELPEDDRRERGE